ncbi:hypothetical protein FD12_GL001983 [Lentilactobacillus rapi DSM 19907 = JCM 15042]|uniref:Uncharacterized protein n=2 Tax=Lentilactobacillus rapi TaxID=481723 RepID=A0A512PPN3_9LACO|nr:hypothetical protein [Lentilactobacillus rapi]KRL17099.1 hypothetical protein FD12_GL001983 [Lentilactobacillus rapi DSM 19907 = JCM 15042]GEP73163.1 hypothetical protein LRA02_20310 [Lentilactobacillus rapi]
MIIDWKLIYVPASYAAKVILNERLIFLKPFIGCHPDNFETYRHFWYHKLVKYEQIGSDTMIYSPLNECDVPTNR